MDVCSTSKSIEEEVARGLYLPPCRVFPAIEARGSDKSLRDWMSAGHAEAAKNITQHTGVGSISLERSHGNLHLSDLSFTYPLKLVAPKASARCQSVYILSYGGGLVGGDAIHLDVVVGRDTSIALMTQGSTKIFKERPHLPATEQRMQVTVHAGATCLLVPDPVQPFAGSLYRQVQEFHLHDHANVILLDWVVSGRPANGECWEFNGFTSINSVFQVVAPALSADGKGPRLMSRDCQMMKGSDTKHQMASYNCLATLLFSGPVTDVASRLVLARFKDEERIRGHSGSRAHHQEGRPVIWTVTRHRDVTILKVVGKGSEQVKGLLSDLVDGFDWRSQFGRDAFRALE